MSQVERTKMLGFDPSNFAVLVRSHVVRLAVPMVDHEEAQLDVAHLYNPPRFLASLLYANTELFVQFPFESSVQGLSGLDMATRKIPDIWIADAPRMPVA